MLIAISSTIIGIVLFLCFVLAFKMGLKLANTVSKGEVPTIKTPLQVFRDVKNGIEDLKKESELKQESEEEIDAWEELNNYDGYTEEERKVMKIEKD